MGEAGALPSWRLTSDREGGWKRTRRRRGGREGGRTGGLRKGVAAGEKLETSAPLGSRTVQLSHSGGEAPCKRPSPPRTRPFVVGLCLWLPLMPSGPLPPPRSHPNCTHNILLCAESVFHHQLPAVSMATRWGGGWAQLWKSRGLAARRPLQTFPGLRVLQQRERALSCAATPSRVRG